MASLGILDADPSEPPSGEDVVCLANRLLGEFNIPTKIERIENINAALFVILYESLFSERLPGIVRQPYSKEDEIHNCQTVIDVLSTEIVRDSLSHIRGAEVVAGNVTAISNLLDIFSYLLEYVVNKIESDVPTDNEADKESELNSLVTEETENQNRIKKEAVTSQGKIFKDLKSNGKQNMTSLDKNENQSSVITHEEFYNMTQGGIKMGDLSTKPEAPPSPIQADHSESLLGQKTLDSTYLDAEVERLKKRIAAASTLPDHTTKVAWSEKYDVKDYPTNPLTGEQADTTSIYHAPQLPNENDSDLCKSQHIFNTDKDFHHESQNLAASVPLPRSTETQDRTERFRATVGPIEYHGRDITKKSHAAEESPEKASDPRMVKGPSSSYNDLQDLVEKTAALTRVALRSSPIRMRAEKELDFSDRPRPVISSDGVRRVKELNALSMKSRNKDRENPTGKANKKVAFVSFGEHSSRDKRSDEKDGFLTQPSEKTENDCGMNDAYPFTSADTRSRSKSREKEMRKPLQNGHLSDSPVRRKPQQSSRAFALHLARNRQPEFGAAHMKLQTEDRALKKKQEFLQRMYQDNLNEFTDDIDVLITTDNEAADDIENELLKSYKKRTSKTKEVKKIKGVSTVSFYKKPKMSRSASSRASYSTTDHKALDSSPKLDLKSDEDLLEVLLEEFPHLHLSDHTWHELWRKGLHQIEALTRVYQENKRKKSRAQSQMEDAAKRHDLLSCIMNKQLEHTKRMREIKERKSQQVQIRNKTHEKRMQSARARRYYNEYQVRARSKQLKRRTKEEMVFRDLFKDALNIQKERINDIRRYTSDQRKRQESRRQDEIDSLENFYHDQFAMLAEKLAQERKDNSLRNAAQQQMLDRMKRELRKKMEHEVKVYQEQIFHDDDDVHYRQIDADKLKHQLHKACYSSL